MIQVLLRSLQYIEKVPDHSFLNYRRRYIGTLVKTASAHIRGHKTHFRQQLQTLASTNDSVGQNLSFFWIGLEIAGRHFIAISTIRIDVFCLMVPFTWGGKRSCTKEIRHKLTISRRLPSIQQNKRPPPNQSILKKSILRKTNELLKLFVCRFKCSRLRCTTFPFHQTAGHGCNSEHFCRCNPSTSWNFTRRIFQGTVYFGGQTPQVELMLECNFTTFSIAAFHF